MSDFLKRLRVVNSARLAAWEEDSPAEPMFHACELGGEVGELLNVAKKLHREAMGWRGSTATKADLADEIGDVLICLDKLASQYGIDLEDATTAKFDRTSDKQGFPHKLGTILRCIHCGRAFDHSLQCVPPFDRQPHQYFATGAA